MPTRGVPSSSKQRARTQARLARWLWPRYVEEVQRANLYALSRAWARKNSHQPRFGTREALYRFLVADSLAAGPIDYLEFGVYKGGSIRTWATLNTDRESRFWGFDSFRGLPEAWGTAGEFPAGSFDANGTAPDVDDARVHFVTGWFQDTVPGFLEGFRTAHPLVVHVDADLYTSTLFCLAQVDRLLRPGSTLVIDDFGNVDEFGAFRDYARAFRREFRTLGLVVMPDEGPDVTAAAFRL
jgi:O-methyltransferase